MKKYNLNNNLSAIFILTLALACNNDHGQEMIKTEIPGPSIELSINGEYFNLEEKYCDVTTFPDYNSLHADLPSPYFVVRMGYHRELNNNVKIHNYLSIFDKSRKPARIGNELIREYIQEKSENYLVEIWVEINGELYKHHWLEDFFDIEELMEYIANRGESPTITEVGEEDVAECLDNFRFLPVNSSFTGKLTNNSNNDTIFLEGMNSTWYVHGL